ncbi:MAG: hypothetical protein ACOVP1_06300 [Bacteroidia bacterium]
MIFSSISFISCKNTDEVIESFGYEYIKSDSGDVFIYKFDSIAFDDNTQSIDTFYYFLKEVNAGKMIQSNGEIFEVIQRFVGKVDSINWEPRASAFVQLKTKSYERIDQNQRRIKLVFPIKSNTIWNGNAYNDLGKMNYIVSGPFDQKTYSNLNFKNVIEVQEANLVNFIETLKEKSAYAHDIGLIYFESTKLSTQANKTGGYSLKCTLIQHY